MTREILTISLWSAYENNTLENVGIESVCIIDAASEKIVQRVGYATTTVGTIGGGGEEGGGGYEEGGE